MAHIMIEDATTSVEIQAGAVVSKVVHRDDDIDVTVFGFDSGEGLDRTHCRPPGDRPGALRTDAFLGRERRGGDGSRHLGPHERRRNTLIDGRGTYSHAPHPAAPALEAGPARLQYLAACRPALFRPYGAIPSNRGTTCLRSSSRSAPAPPWSLCRRVRRRCPLSRFRGRPGRVPLSLRQGSLTRRERRHRPPRPRNRDTGRPAVETTRGHHLNITMGYTEFTHADEPSRPAGSVHRWTVCEGER